MKTFITILIVLALATCWAIPKTCSWIGYRNVEAVKTSAPKVWQDAGFTVVGYEGYRFSLFGSSVWYILRKTADNGITYKGALTKWGNEYHIYNLKAIDAIKP